MHNNFPLLIDQKIRRPGGGMLGPTPFLANLTREGWQEKNLCTHPPLKACTGSVGARSWSPCMTGCRRPSEHSRPLKRLPVPLKQASDVILHQPRVTVAVMPSICVNTAYSLVTTKRQCLYEKPQAPTRAQQAAQVVSLNQSSDFDAY